MKEFLVVVTEHAVLIIDALALIVVAYAAIDAFVRAFCAALIYQVDFAKQREVWLRFSRFLVAGLTFQLAADIIETSISTTWESLGRIAIIAVIRTFLNYFLEKDVERLGESAAPERVQPS